MKIEMWSLVLTAVLFAMSACETSEKTAETASAEFCECMEEKTLSECEKELNRKYSTYTNNDKFISAFNTANTCGVTIRKKE